MTTAPSENRGPVAMAIMESTLKIDRVCSIPRRRLAGNTGVEQGAISRGPSRGAESSRGRAAPPERTKQLILNARELGRAPRAVAVAAWAVPYPTAARVPLEGEGF